MKLLNYIKEYGKFKASGYSCIQSLIDEANKTYPPIQLTKLKRGEVVESVRVSSGESYDDLTIDIEMGVK